LLAESEVLEQKTLLRDEERPNRGPDDGKQERHPSMLAEDKNVNDFKSDGIFADYRGIEYLAVAGKAAELGPKLSRNPNI
jgi:hypothetical protein